MSFPVLEAAPAFLDRTVEVGAVEVGQAKADDGVGEYGAIGSVEHYGGCKARSHLNRKVGAGGTATREINKRCGAVHVQFAPTVMFHGPDGAALAEPIVGFRLADFYAAYLDRAIEESRAQLQTRK